MMSAGTSLRLWWQMWWQRLRPLFKPYRDGFMNSNEMRASASLSNQAQVRQASRCNLSVQLWMMQEKRNLVNPRFNLSVEFSMMQAKMNLVSPRSVLICLKMRAYKL